MHVLLSILDDLKGLCNRVHVSGSTKGVFTDEMVIYITNIDIFLPVVFFETKQEWVECCLRRD